MSLDEEIAMYSPAKPARASEPAAYANTPSRYARMKEGIKEFFYQPTIPHKLGMWYGLYRLSGVKPQFVQDKPLEELATMSDADKIISIAGNTAGVARWVAGDLPLYVADGAVWLVRAGYYVAKSALVTATQGVKMGIDTLIGNAEGHALAQEVLGDSLLRSMHHLGEFKYIPWHNSRGIVDFDHWEGIADPTWYEHITNLGVAAQNGMVDLLERYQLHLEALPIAGAILAGTYWWKRRYLKNLALPGADDD